MFRSLGDVEGEVGFDSARTHPLALLLNGIVIVRLLLPLCNNNWYLAALSQCCRRPSLVSWSALISKLLHLIDLRVPVMVCLLVNVADFSSVLANFLDVDGEAVVISVYMYILNIMAYPFSAVR